MDAATQRAASLTSAEVCLAWARDFSNGMAGGGAAVLLAVLFAPQVPRSVGAALAILAVLLLVVFTLYFGAAVRYITGTALPSRGMVTIGAGVLLVALGYGLVVLLANWPVRRGSGSWTWIVVMTVYVSIMGLGNRRLVERTGRQLSAARAVLSKSPPHDDG